MEKALISLKPLPSHTVLRFSLFAVIWLFLCPTARQCGKCAWNKSSLLQPGQHQRPPG